MMTQSWKQVALFATIFCLSCSLVLANDEAVDNHHDKKVLSIFNVVTFDNDICAGSGTQNGTCYTADECTSRGGTASGTCASGYGVCCIISLSCGGTSSDNCTYIEQSSFTAASSLSATPCEYTLCRMDTNICRIRLDFNTFQIASPVVATAETITVGGESIGDCAEDTFTFTTPGMSGAPVICGLNTGQHMILDASDMCSKVRFTIGSTTTSRMWNIKATQFECGDQDGMGGPNGCLQYFRGTTGNVGSFNYDLSATTTANVDNADVTVQHLSNQYYNVCIRREASMCRICWAPTVPPAATISGSSFGLSISSNAIGKSSIDTRCDADYVTIHDGNSDAITAIAAMFPVAGANRFCGRFFNEADATQASSTVCSRAVPFRLGVNFDADEVVGVAAAITSELSAMPTDVSGTLGFLLTYTQTAC